MSVVRVPVEDSEKPKLVAIIDEVDAVKVFAHDWRTEWDYRMKKTYAVAKTHLGGGEYRTIKMHHLIMPPMGGMQPYHRDGNPMNNTRANLEMTDRSKSGSRSAGKSSIFKGVTYHKGTNKWQAQLTINYRNVQIGRYATEIEAAKAYDHAVRQWRGPDAITNFPEDQP